MIQLDPLRDGSAADRNFQTLMRLVLDTGGRTIGIRWGVQALTFTASTNSATAIVDHGLGKTPAGVIATGQDAPAFGKIPKANPHSLTSTQFGLNAELQTAHTGNINVFWVVIG